MHLNPVCVKETWKFQIIPVAFLSKYGEVQKKFPPWYSVSFSSLSEIFSPLLTLNFAECNNLLCNTMLNPVRWQVWIEKLRHTGKFRSFHDSIALYIYNIKITMWNIYFKLRSGVFNLLDYVSPIRILKYGDGKKIKIEFESKTCKITTASEALFLLMTCAIIYRFLWAKKIK